MDGADSVALAWETSLLSGLPISVRERDNMLRALQIWEAQIAGQSDLIRAEAYASMLHGRPVFYWSPVLSALARGGRLEAALSLAVECVDLAEKALRRGDGPPPPGWTRRACVYAHKLGRFDEEAQLLERYLAVAGDNADPQLVARRALVAAAADRRDALMPVPRPAPMWDD